MRPGSYLRDRLPLFLLLMAASVVGAVLLQGTGTARDAALFVIILFDLCVLVWVAIDCVRKHRFYRDVARWVEKNRTENQPVSQLDEPGFAEGQALYAALERVDAARQEALAQRELEMREYREYIESWVHEIKTPLASARLYLDNHPAEGSARLQAELSRVEEYVSQVLYYARASSLEKDFCVRAVSLRDVVRALLKKHAMPLIETGFSIEQRDLDVEVMADAAYLEFVLGQVLSNALKYRSEAPKLAFRAERREHSVLLRVRDNGIGIPQEDLPRIFEKGFCGQNGRRLGKSTGMGLFIARKLCGKMGLTIQAESEEGAFTCITLQFPVGDAYDLTKV